MVKFEWDDAKNHENQRKHGVSFEEASTLFASGNDYLEIYDADHSDDEDRFIAVGAVVDGVLVVIWTERADDVVRIISARRATPSEVDLYQDYMDSIT